MKNSKFSSSSHLLFIIRFLLTFLLNSVVMWFFFLLKCDQNSADIESLGALSIAAIIHMTLLETKVSSFTSY